MSKTAKFAGAQVVFFFMVEDEEGDVETVPTQPLNINSKTWRSEWESPGAQAVIDQAVLQLQTPTGTNGTNRQQRRQAARKKK